MLCVSIIPWILWQVHQILKKIIAIFQNQNQFVVEIKFHSKHGCFISREINMKCKMVSESIIKLAVDLYFLMSSQMNIDCDINQKTPNNIDND